MQRMRATRSVPARSCTFIHKCASSPCKDDEHGDDQHCARDEGDDPDQAGRPVQGVFLVYCTLTDFETPTGSPEKAGTFTDLNILATQPPAVVPARSPVTSA